MKKKIYKILDSQGRIVIPQELREKVDIQKGDVIELIIVKNAIQIEKVDIIKLNDDSIHSMCNTVVATAKKLDKKNLLVLARRLMEMAEKEEKND